MQKMGTLIWNTIKHLKEIFLLKDIKTLPWSCFLFLAHVGLSLVLPNNRNNKMNEHTAFLSHSEPQVKQQHCLYSLGKRKPEY